MLRFGVAPYLECSSKGDKRYSAFYATIKRRNNQSIESLYQGFKLFKIDGQLVQGLSVKEAKGKVPLNIDACHLFYRELWAEYFHENPNLLSFAQQYSGFSDIFGQAGHCCQAEEIHRLVEYTRSGH